MLEVKPVETTLNGGKVLGRKKPYPVVVTREASLDIRSDVTQHFKRPSGPALCLLVGL